MKRLGLREATCLVSLILAMVGGAGGAAWAAPIDPGFDIFHTPDGTAFLPAGALGPTPVPLMSRPIPGLGNADTIVQRKSGLPAGGVGDIPIEIVALSLHSVSPIEISPGSFFDVFVTINPLGLSGVPQTNTLSPSAGMMQVTSHNDGTGGGTFDSFFDVFVEIELALPGTDTIVQRAPGEQVHITGTGNPWSHTRPLGYPEMPEFPGGDFYPGTVQHTGPHPIVVPAVPEPASLALLASGLLLVGAVSLARRRSGS